MNVATLALGFPGSWEWLVVVLVALLIFGRRLPEVARSVGKSIVEFKKGIKEVKDDVEVQSRLEPPPEPKLERKPEVTAEPTPESANDSTSTTEATTKSAPDP